MPPQKVIILGLGNILCGDDAFGVAVADKLCRKYAFPANVDIVDGGAQGAALFTYVQEADCLIVIDAVDFGQLPGAITKSEGNLPCWLGIKKMSAHQSSFAELLALAELKNALPERIFLIGLQPVSLEFGRKPSPQAINAIDDALQLCLKILQELGIEAKESETGKSLVADELWQ